MKKFLLMAALLTAGNSIAQEQTETFTDLSSFTLCEFTLIDLKAMDKDIALVDVNEMGYCSGKQAFDFGKGYISKKYPGVIFQKETETERISKLQLTAEFNGILPNGKQINVSELNTDTVLELLTDKKIMTAGECENFNNFSEDGIRFYFTGNASEATAITGVDVVLECPRLAPVNEIRNPIFFINGEEATTEQVGKLKPDDIKSYELINAAEAKKKYGEKGAFGVVLIRTKN